MELGCHSKVKINIRVQSLPCEGVGESDSLPTLASVGKPSYSPTPSKGKPLDSDDDPDFEGTPYFHRGICAFEHKIQGRSEQVPVAVKPSHITHLNVAGGQQIHFAHLQ